MTSTVETAEDRQARVVEQTKEALMTGRAFLNRAASYRSIRGSRCVQGRQGYAHCIETLGRMAQHSDALAQVASAIVREVPLYQTDAEAAAKVYMAAFHVLAEPYDDVVGRAAPDAGRRSDHLHGWSLAQRLLIAGWLEVACAKFWLGSVPGHGWAFEAIAAELHVNLPPVPKS